MAEYIYMQNCSKNGKMGISYKVIEKIAADSCYSMIDKVLIDKTGKGKAITCTINKGKAYLNVRIKVKQGSNAASTASLLQEEISKNLISTIEFSDCVININVVGIF